MNLLIDVALPAAILLKLSSPDRLGPLGALLLALSIPLARSIWSLWKERRLSQTAGLGLVSVVLLGGIALLQLPAEWVAVKEGAVPLGVGVVLGIAQLRGKPLAAGILLSTVDVERVKRKLSAGGEEAYKVLVNRVSTIVTLSFFLSAVVNFAVARVIVTAQPNTVELNEQIAATSLVSFIATVATAGAMIIGGHLYLLRGLRDLTGIPMTEVLKGGSSTA